MGPAADGSSDAQRMDEDAARLVADPDALPAHGVVRAALLASPSLAHEEGLVALACDEPYWVTEHEGRYALLIPEANAARVLEQLALYREEAARPRERPAPVPRGQPVRAGLLFIPGIYWFIQFALQDAHPAVTQAGLADSAAVLHGGEWWRVVTALTLHADVGHLMANCLGWLLFGAMLATSMGVGLATFVALVAGAAGNLVNLAGLERVGHQSLGASTALFAALGAQTACALWAGSRGVPLMRRLLVPLAMSAALLALMGAGGGPRTDVGAHAWGYACGLVLTSPLCRPLRRWKATALRDWLLMGLSGAIVAFAWAQA